MSAPLIGDAILGIALFLLFVIVSDAIAEAMAWWKCRKKKQGEREIIRRMLE